MLSIDTALLQKYISRMEKVSPRRLDSITLLRHLSAEQRRHIESLCQFHYYRKNEIILESGQSAEDLLFLISGYLKVSKKTRNGERETGFAFVEPGEIFGDLAIMDGLPRSATTKALTASLVASLPRRHALQMIRENRDISWEIIRRYTSIIREQNEFLVDINEQDATHRIYKLLLKSAIRCGQNAQTPRVINPLPNQSDIAAMTITSRETVSRVLKRLRDAMIIAKSGNTLTILDEKRLEGLSKSG